MTLINDLNIKSKILNEGENFTMIIVGNKSGNYKYYCLLHPDEMHGNITNGT